ncbi:adenylate cyclase type 9 isoform X2 [Patella vulgata]|uniref:adenylate cyclase type 9 isoform X2 n=1 Tax=Patella vulgata TaxID=6465 RepID=UPI00217F9E13|nr:adenylate cyclase type 9 isoform X2 [Patella vulgata]
MASNGETAVFNAIDPESVQVDIKSPAKNRYTSSPLHPNKRKGPVLFERASGSWWNPKFDSSILEEYLWQCYFPQTQRRFQYVLLYIVVACAAWCIFFGLMRENNWIVYVSGAAVLALISILTLVFTKTGKYPLMYIPTSVVYTVVLGLLLLVGFLFNPADLSTVGSFCASVEILLLVYTFIPMPLFVAVLIGGGYSIIYEVLTALGHPIMNRYDFIIGKILLHLCIHLIGIHIFFMSEVRRRSTFWKIGQSLIVKRELIREKKNKEKMIHSLMPPSVAEEAMRTREGKEKDEDDPSKKKGKVKSAKGKIIFRSFNMNKMDKVSILFADIVGFTKMSSNKTAETLVGLLNDLFGRFDKLCVDTGCEKITTLGDCYYCVSGCPKPRDDHAECCVEMGRGMIKAIKQFDEEKKESVDMRVGVHTGTVLCGLVGKCRFKFDVWSNDVTLANNLESTGRPGQVHISECTYAYIKDDYVVEPAEPIEDLRTHKVLIEHYSSVSSSFTIRHTEEQKKLNTYFVIDKIKKGIEKDGSTNNLVVIPMEESEDQLKGEKQAENITSDGDVVINHLDRESSGINGVTPSTLLTRRHSDTSMDKNMEDKGSDVEAAGDPSLVPMNPDWTNCSHMKEENDNKIVACINENVKNKSFFYEPEINRLTLCFLNADMEEDFRDHYLESNLGKEETMASPRYHSLIEAVLSLIVFILISICCFLVFGYHIVWLFVFIIALIIEILVLIQLATDVKIGLKKKEKCSMLMHILSGWYFRNSMGAVIAIIPIIAVYSNLSCELATNDQWKDRFFCFTAIVALLHFCNFTMLSAWVKSFLVTVAGIALLILLSVRFCPPEEFVHVKPIVTLFANTTSASPTYKVNQSTLSDHLFSGENNLRYEIILDIILLLLLILFISREFEISYRLSYFGSSQSEKQRVQMMENKEQAEWLLHNIVPAHITAIVKQTSTYSKNHKDIGVIFATIVNFNDFYDESYEGGREYLRVLNELYSDFEDLLDEPRFKDVEKIKTISSTFMAASGLNEQNRAKNKNPNAHLYALLEFAQELQNKIGQFNDSIFNFDFQMKIGYNFGEVTAGVIGTTKLLYDIWGDTVNIASRMYSTGEMDQIQVPESTVQRLGDKFSFGNERKVLVKGKGEMKVYFLEKKIEGATWE